MESFKLFDDMFSFHQKVSSALEESHVSDHNPILQDDMAAWYDEIHENLRHMLKFRSHIAQQEDEAKFVKEFYSTMKQGDVLVIMIIKCKYLHQFLERNKLIGSAKEGSAAWDV